MTPGRDLRQWLPAGLTLLITHRGKNVPKRRAGDGAAPPGVGEVSAATPRAAVPGDPASTVVSGHSPSVSDNGRMNVTAVSVRSVHW